MGSGLGDVVVALPILSAISRQEKAVLVARSPRQLGFELLVPGLTGIIKELELVQKKLEPHERYINLREHRLQTDYFWGSPEFERDYPGFLINDILAEICGDFGIHPEFEKLSPLPFCRRAELAKAIICIPGTTVDAKTWSASNWLELRRHLEEAGYNCFMLGQPERASVVLELQKQGFPLLSTPELSDAVNIMSSAKAVISVDTGLMHLAVNQMIPTVGLFQDPIYYRPYPHAFMLLSKHCAPECIERRMESKPQTIVDYPEWKWEVGAFSFCLVPEKERCINSITVEDILNCLRHHSIL